MSSVSVVELRIRQITPYCTPPRVAHAITIYGRFVAFSPSLLTTNDRTIDRRYFRVGGGLLVTLD